MNPTVLTKSYFFLIGAVLIASVSFAQTPSIRFVDVTEQSGIDFRYNFGDETYENIMESSGGGVTVFDYNGDGFMDIYLLNGTYLEGLSDPEGAKYTNSNDALYRNNGDGTFTNVTEEAGLIDYNWSMAAAALDYDNDGDVDIYLLNYGPNRFFRNNGDGTFTEVTDELGLRGPETLNGFPTWSVGASFWDQNDDGLVDVMVCNFLAFDPAIVSPSGPDVMPHPGQYPGQASLFYRQRPDGTFEDVTEQLGLYFPDSMCMGITIFDFDDDGDLDIFQANDHQDNFLFRNDGNGTFVDVAGRAGVAVNDQGIPAGSMHGSIGDIDGDGLMDILVVDLSWGALYHNRGEGLFEDVTRARGVATPLAGKGGWGAFFFDFDNDGDQDIFSANGAGDWYELTLPLLLENDGKGFFKDSGPQLSPYFRVERSGRGAAMLDYDNDGDLDLIVNHVDLGATPALLRNDGGNQNHWLGLTLIGSRGPASALGAKVTVEAGGQRQVGVNQPATSYLSYNDPRMHFGLGTHRTIERLEIRWPDGKTEVFTDLEADQYLTIVQGQGIRK